VLELSPLHGEQDWLNLLEYLAADYDPDRDLPRLKPYAHRRTVHHGQERPWIDRFDRIEIRLIYRDPAADEMAQRIGSALGEYVLGQVLPKSPYYRQAPGKLRIHVSNPNSPRGK
jgi:hypothetical protein